MLQMVINGREEAEQSILRISDIAEEPHEMLMPIGGYDEMPLVSLEEAVKPLISLLPKIRDCVRAAKQRCKRPANNLTSDESASIMLYTMEWEPLDQCLYVALNKTLRSKDRQQLKPWFLYLKLFLTALWRLPSTQKFIYRSVRFNLSAYYSTGKTVVWWGFSYCAVSVDVLKSQRYLRKSGAKTIFVIDCHSSKDISKHSYHPTKDQFLLLCATQFRVLSSVNQGYGLHIVQLQEIQPKTPLLQPVTVVKRTSGKNKNTM
jgi:hypothetical protein